jgi:hypothetical protein
VGPLFLGTPYVGWDTFDPTITFHFAGLKSTNAVSLSVDNTIGYRGVSLPSQIDIAMGATTETFAIPPDNSNPAPRTLITYTFSNLGLSGSTLDLTVHRSNQWVMVSEVQFDGAPVPVPPTILLFGSGLVGLVGWRRFRKS